MIFPFRDDVPARRTPLVTYAIIAINVAALIWLSRLPPLAQNAAADPDNAGAGAYAYMDLMGLVTLGWMWLKMAKAAENAQDTAFREAKLATARFYAERELPGSTALRRKIEAGAETLMKIPAEAF